MKCEHNRSAYECAGCDRKCCWDCHAPLDREATLDLPIKTVGGRFCDKCLPAWVAEDCRDPSFERARLARMVIGLRGLFAEARRLYAVGDDNQAEIVDRVAARTELRRLLG